jgi:mono/diheme cytochrome c family protein
MKRVVMSVLMGASVALAVFAVQAQPKVDLGKSEYMANCASCHGASGKGDGPNAPYLNRMATDLTTLAKKNGGVLPISRLYESIDGEKVPAGHGSRDMPTWGFDYRVRAAEYYGEFPYDSAQYVRSRVLALIEYISRLQVK